MNVEVLFQKLSDLGFSLNCLNQKNLVREISSLEFDSRKVQENSVFFAIPGTSIDGTKFVGQVLEKDVAAVFIEDSEKGQLKEILNTTTVPIISCTNIRKVLTVSASIFYQTESENLNIAAVTGTNGKTSIAWMIAQLCDLKFDKSFYMGTLGSVLFKEGDNIQVEDDGRTSTDPVSLHRLLKLLYTFLHK